MVEDFLRFLSMLASRANDKAWVLGDARVHDATMRLYTQLEEAANILRNAREARENHDEQSPDRPKQDGDVESHVDQEPN